MTPLEIPICRIIAGPNGEGKTTFALTYLGQFPDAPAFVNADLIAAGLSPLAPQQQLQAASRRRLRAAGWRVELIYLALPSVELSILRVAERVAHGGHNVPLPVLQLRFPRSIRLLLDAYAPALVDAMVYAYLLDLAR